MDQYVRDALREGLYGWPVTDCVVTMFSCGYSVADGPPSRRGPPSTAADFRKLTPLVLMARSQRAGTVVCEPISRVSLEIPLWAHGRRPDRARPARRGGPRTSRSAATTTIEAELPAARCRTCTGSCRR